MTALGSRRRIGKECSTRSCNSNLPRTTKQDLDWGWQSSSAPSSGMAAKLSFQSPRWAGPACPPRGPQYPPTDNGSVRAWECISETLKLQVTLDRDEYR